MATWKRLRASTCPRRLQSDLPLLRAIEFSPDPRLAVHLPMSFAVKILLTRTQTLLHLGDGSGVSARSHRHPPLNDRHQEPKRTLKELEAANLVYITMNSARSGASRVCSRVVHWMLAAPMWSSTSPGDIATNTPSA